MRNTIFLFLKELTRPLTCEGAFKFSHYKIPLFSLLRSTASTWTTLRTVYYIKYFENHLNNAKM